jgi:hypothetical protein
MLTEFIGRIVMQSQRRGFAVYDIAPNGSIGNLPFGNGHILRTEDGQIWENIGAGFCRRSFLWYGYNRG